MRLSWNEMRTRATKFSREWAHAAFEKHVQRLDNTSGFIYLFCPASCSSSRRPPPATLTAARGQVAS